MITNEIVYTCNKKKGLVPKTLLYFSNTSVQKVPEKPIKGRKRSKSSCSIEEAKEAITPICNIKQAKLTESISPVHKEDIKKKSPRRKSAEIQKAVVNSTTNPTESLKVAKKRRSRDSQPCSTAVCSSTPSSSTKEESYSASKNLRSNTCASVIPGIPYYQSFKDFTRDFFKKFRKSPAETVTSEKTDRQVLNKSLSTDSAPKTFTEPSQTRSRSRSLSQGSEPQPSTAKKAKTDILVKKKRTSRGSLEKDLKVKTSSPSPNSSPELKSFRRTRSSKNTGSCASTRYYLASSLDFKFVINILEKNCFEICNGPFMSSRNFSCFWSNNI